MRLAIWDTEPSSFIEYGMGTGTHSFFLEIERQKSRNCASLLLGGVADIALVPTLEILKKTDQFDILPAVAFSSWSYPYARIVLRSDLSRPIKTLAHDPQYEQEGFIASVVIKEHYGTDPTTILVEGLSLDTYRDTEADALLLVGDSIPQLDTDLTSLDLGQEWYELANYPMVWGLFAMRKGEVTPEIIIGIRDMIRATDARREEWISKYKPRVEVENFIRDDIRLRFDDLAIASLTEYRQFLFYHEVLDEIPDLPIVTYEDGEGNEEDLPLI